MIEETADQQIAIKQYMEKSKGVLHLGAHLGQEAQKYFKMRKKVMWVEAIPNIFVELENRIKSFPEQMCLNALLGDKNNATVTFYISNNTRGVSSSVYQFGAHGNGDKALWPDKKLAMISEITLTMKTLDVLMQENGISMESYDFWVLDLQGAEKLALMGASESLASCNAILSEVSTVDVYDGGVLWPELCDVMREHHFIPLWQPSLPHQDVLFIKKV